MANPEITIVYLEGFDHDKFPPDLKLGDDLGGLDVVIPPDISIEDAVEYAHLIGLGNSDAAARSQLSLFPNTTQSNVYKHR